MKVHAIYPNILVYVLIALSLSACGIGDASNKSAEPVWVYAQFNVPEEENYIEPHWYYGRVDGDLARAISSNEVTTGFITLEEVRYWDDNNEIALYEDHIDSGKVTFRIEHLVKFSEMKTSLDEGFSYDESYEIAEDTADKQ